MYFRHLKYKWQKFGLIDPLWSILALDNKYGRKWEVEEFFRTGEKEIAELTKTIDAISPDFKKRRALDFGCGVGRLTQPLSSAYETVCGIDVAPSMIDLAKKYNRHCNCRYILNARPDLKIFSDGNFDLIYSNITLQHMEKKFMIGYLREFFRILDDGGILVFQIAGEPKEKPRSSFLREVIKKIIPFFVLDEYRRLRYGRLNMDIYGLKKAEVYELVDSFGGRVVKCEENDIVVSWTSFRYFVVKKSTSI